MIPLDPLPPLDARLRMALAEDLGAAGDITTQSVFGDDAARRVRATIRAKEAGIVSAVDAAARVFTLLDASVVTEIARTEGSEVAPGDVVLRIDGPVGAVLAGERTALNLLQRMSGTATLTRAFVRRVAGRAIVLDTRKTTPLWRDLQKAAVRAGGGTNHRLGLHDAYMVKDTHVDGAGGVGAALAAVAAHRRRGGPAAATRAIVVEVRTMGELRDVLACGDRPDVVLLDNMRGADLRAALDVLAGTVASEVSGGVTLDTVAALAAEGVDRISVGALTHSAPALDFSLTLA